MKKLRLCLLLFIIRVFIFVTLAASVNMLQTIQSITQQSKSFFFFFWLHTSLLKCSAILKTCHHQLIHYNLNFNQVLQDGMSEVCVSFFSHMQPRGGSCSELSCLRSQDILSTTSFITSALINHCVCCISLFCPSCICVKIQCSKYSSILNYHTCVCM